LSRLYAEGKPIAYLVLRLTVGMALVGVVPFGAMFLLAPMLLPLLGGPQWEGASQSVSLLTLASYFFFIVAPASNVALIVGARRYMILWHALRLGSLVVIGAVAGLGWISYSEWLVLTVSSDLLLYTFNGVTSFALALPAESKSQGNGVRVA
jgi:O-antigen/teichoic acid export membrane protein